MKCIFILLLFLANTVATQETSERTEDVISHSTCGGYRLKLKTVSQKPSPWDDDIAAVSLTFDLEFSQTLTQGFRHHRPPDTYIENHDPLVSAHIEPDQDVSQNKHFGWTDNSGSTVTLRDLELGKTQNELGALTLAVTIVRVKTWENVNFDGVMKGDSDFLKCGPFQLVVSSEEKKVVVSAASFSKFKDEKGEYEKRVPLRFLNHSYGIRHTRILDAKKRELINTGVTFTGGSSSGSFEIPMPSVGSINLDNEDPTKYLIEFKPNPAPVRAVIAYPLQVELRLPKEYETERIVFDFTDIRLPELKKDKS